MAVCFRLCGPSLEAMEENDRHEYCVVRRAATRGSKSVDGMVGLTQISHKQAGLLGEKELSKSTTRTLEEVPRSASVDIESGCLIGSGHCAWKQGVAWDPASPSHDLASLLHINVHDLGLVVRLVSMFVGAWSSRVAQSILSWK